MPKISKFKAFVLALASIIVAKVSDTLLGEAITKLSNKYNIVENALKWSGGFLVTAWDHITGPFGVGFMIAALLFSLQDWPFVRHLLEALRKKKLTKLMMQSEIVGETLDLSDLARLERNTYTQLKLRDCEVRGGNIVLGGRCELHSPKFARSNAIPIPVGAVLIAAESFVGFANTTFDNVNFVDVCLFTTNNQCEALDGAIGRPTEVATSKKAAIADLQF